MSLPSQLLLHVIAQQGLALVSESESELLMVTGLTDNHTPGPVIREVSP